MSFEFNLLINYNPSKPDYIITFDYNHYKIDEKVKIAYEQINTTLIIRNNNKNIIEHKDKIETEFIKEIKLIDYIQIIKNNNEYHIYYPKFNDLKFLRILKNILQKYYKLNNESSTIDFISDKNDYKCICLLHNPRYYKQTFYPYDINYSSMYYGSADKIIEYYMCYDLNINLHYWIYGQCDNDGIKCRLDYLINIYQTKYDILCEKTIDDKHFEGLKALNENKILKQKVEDLQAEKEYFQQEYNMLQDNQYNYEELQKENEILQDNYLNLKSNFEIYTELINELRNENKELKKQIEDLKNENIDLYSNLI